MKLAVIGSRTLTIETIDTYIPKTCQEIVSGGAKGVDQSAADYAKRNGLKLTLFLPDYKAFGRSAPLKRNLTIAAYADECIAFWDGHSKGTHFTIIAFQCLKKKVTVISMPPPSPL